MNANHIEKFLNEICNKIKYKPIRSNIKKELYEHILISKNEYINNGLTEEQAEKKTLENLGTPDIISAEFNDIYKRKIDFKLIVSFLGLVLLNIFLLVTLFTQQNISVFSFKLNMVYIFIGTLFSFIMFFINYQYLLKYNKRNLSTRLFF